MINSIFVIKATMREVLYQELIDSRFFVNISFEWSGSGHLFSVLFTNGDKAEVKINLQVVKTALVDTSNIAINIVFCVYYIVSYLRHVENLQNFIPQNYFEGLVAIDEISDLVSKRRAKVGFPFSREKTSLDIRVRRPLEVKHAIAALTRICLQNGVGLEQGMKEKVYKLRDKLLLYSSLPEIICKKRLFSQYSVTCLVKTAMVLSHNQKNVNDFMLLRIFKNEFLDKQIEEIDYDRLASNYYFVYEVMMRIQCISQSNKPIETENEKTIVAEWVRDFIERSVDYYKECVSLEDSFLKINLKAVGILLREINELSVELINSDMAGTIHYMY